MRRAFDATMKVPQLVAEAAKMKLAIDSIDGVQVAGLIDRLYSLPKEVIAKAAQAARPR